MQIVLTVNPAVKAKTVAELVALAKAAPGTMNFGSSGYGSTNHLAGELFKSSPASTSSMCRIGAPHPP